ncbi:hypothetical protein CPB86DRAFT_793310 [Serendipita vermifera]|nr:hypothetical protein CPB86DRAFT_793310 [Serendipita vermifera]
MASPPKTPVSLESPEIIGQTNPELSPSPFPLNQHRSCLLLACLERDMAADKCHTDAAVPQEHSPGFCGLIGCLWVPVCRIPAHFNYQPSQVGNPSIGSGNSTLEGPPSPRFNSPSSMSSPTAISSPLSSLPPSAFGPFIPVTSSPGMETGNQTPLPPSPSFSSLSSPNQSEADMNYGVNTPSHDQFNPFLEIPHLHELFERICLIVASGQYDESIKKNEDVAEFLIERLLPSTSKGKGSRGGKESYSCAFPGCGTLCSRRDRGVDHVLIHFGARPYRCKYWFLRKADLERHKVRNGTCPGNGIERGACKDISSEVKNNYVVSELY